MSEAVWQKYFDKSDWCALKLLLIGKGYNKLIVIQRTDIMGLNVIKNH